MPRTGQKGALDLHDPTGSCSQRHHSSDWSIWLLLRADGRAAVGTLCCWVCGATARRRLLGNEVLLFGVELVPYANVVVSSKWHAVACLCGSLWNLHRSWQCCYLPGCECKERIHGRLHRLSASVDTTAAALSRPVWVLLLK